MPFYKRIYRAGQRQFITTRTCQPGGHLQAIRAPLGFAGAGARVLCVRLQEPQAGRRGDGGNVPKILRPDYGERGDRARFAGVAGQEIHRGGAEAQRKEQ